MESANTNHMTIREQCAELLNGFSDEQLQNVAALLESAKKLADEAADDAYCARLYAEYQNDQDKDDAMALEDFAESVGVKLP